MRSLKYMLITAIAVFCIGCGAKVEAPVNGMLFTKVKGPIEGNAEAEGAKIGEACANSILGLVAAGDASVTAAKNAAGITKISVVDHQSTSVLGIYAQYCTIVTGE